jgi:hypothetical protein
MTTGCKPLVREDLRRKCAIGAIFIELTARRQGL